MKYATASILPLPAKNLDFRIIMTEENLINCLFEDKEAAVGLIIAHSVMDSHTTGPGFKTGGVRYTFYRASD